MLQYLQEYTAVNPGEPATIADFDEDLPRQFVKGNCAQS